MTTPRAILIGAVIIGLSIIGARVIAPYQISSDGLVAWRLNTITGETLICNLSNSGGALVKTCRNGEY